MNPKDIARLITEDPDVWEEPTEADHINNIIDYAEQLGLHFSEDEIREALRQVGLDAEDISNNQAITDGEPMPPGQYKMYKGLKDGDGDPKGWVTDDAELAKGHGRVVEIDINYNGETIEWSTVSDWDGYPQLVPPGPRLRKVYEDGYLWL